MHCRELDDVARFDCVKRATVRGIHVQRSVRTPVMIVIDVTGKQTPEVTLIENSDVIEKLSAKAADQSFDIRVGSSCQLHRIGTLRYESLK